MLSTLAEFGSFLLARKRFWLVPLVVMMALLGVLLVLAHGTGAAPFIYTLF